MYGIGSPQTSTIEEACSQKKKKRKKKKKKKKPQYLVNNCVKHNYTINFV